MTMQAIAESRFDRLTDFLAHDPDNLGLIAEAAQAALDENRPGDAAAMVERYAASAPLTPSLVNVMGLAALAEGRNADAEAIFRSLSSSFPDDSNLRFNLAWAMGRQGNHEAVLNTLGQAADTPEAKALMVRSLHRLDRLDEALALGDHWEASGSSDGEDDDLWGALASIALDAEDMDRAGRWAVRAPRSPEGLAASGILALDRGDDIAAQTMLEAALQLRPDLARAQLGLGSLRLYQGNPRAAAEAFDRAAETFANHLGSWVSAGWAWLIAGETETARARFETARTLDDTFSEVHGGLAVLAVLEGRDAEAEDLAEVARRLDPEGLGATLARVLLLEKQGDDARAARLREAVMAMPIGPEGQSIATAIARRGVRGP